MSEFLWVGMTLGAVIGLLHMLHTFATRLGRSGLSSVKTLWQGIWTWALWTLFGAYLLVFWILGLVSLGISRVVHHARGSA